MEGAEPTAKECSEPWAPLHGPYPPCFNRLRAWLSINVASSTSTITSKCPLPINTTKKPAGILLNTQKLLFKNTTLKHTCNLFFLK